MNDQARFEPPGPGPWELETAHFPRPMTRFVASPMLAGFAAGFAEGTARYGLLLESMKPSLVNGFMYQQPVAFGAPEGAMGPPPKPVLWLLTRLAPKLRARIETCRQAFESKQWRADLKEWDEQARPAAVAKHRALQEVDPQQLSTPELTEQLRHASNHVAEMITLHHRYTITCCLPIGDLLAHAMEWTGASAGEVLELLRGSSPISNGVAADELVSLAAAIRASDAAKEVLAGSDDPQATLDRLLALDGAAGVHARAYYDVVRYRLVGYDVGDKAAGEMPELLVKAIRAAVDGSGIAKALAGRDDKERALRERVPPEHRALFDQLLAEARLINRLRDERGVYSDGWGTGLARRCVLEAGRRLAQTGALLQADHAVDLSLEELSALLSGQAGPSADEVKKRVQWRLTKTVADAPAFLRAMPAPPPSPDILPPAARRATRAIDAVLTNLFKVSDAKSTREVVRGLPVNDGVYEGTARVVDDPSEFANVQKGDVLVARATSPYFNVVLPLLGAIVTDRGGQLCHAAIVAREYGIPGIVGTKVATTTIESGARVRVDGGSGEVTILAGPS